jgi:hypothetical protein
MNRRIIRIDSSGMSVAREARFDSEAQLHLAIAEHIEVLPHDELGLAALIPLATEVDFGGGPIDLLAVDATGRLAIVEFKRGTENPDVRAVVAQILEYGASVWRVGYDRLEEACQRAGGFAGALSDHAAEWLGARDETFDLAAFRGGVEASLDAGAFVFIYCGRDLDERTRRIMTYLAEGPRMHFFAVEVDHFRDENGNSSVLVPRLAFIPSWITGPGESSLPRAPRVRPSDAPREFWEVIDQMNALAQVLDLHVVERATGFTYAPRIPENGSIVAKYGIGVYASSRGVEFNLAVLREFGKDRIADELRDRLCSIFGLAKLGGKWPSIECPAVLTHWSRVREEIIEPYFAARSLR